MPHPVLNLFHGNAVGQQHRRAAMSQIVESDDAQPVFLQEFRKIFRDVIRACPFPKLVNTDVIKVVGAVRFSTKAAKFFLLWFAIGALLSVFLEGGSLAKSIWGIKYADTVSASEGSTETSSFGGETPQN